MSLLKFNTYTAAYNLMNTYKISIQNRKSNLTSNQKSLLRAHTALLAYPHVQQYKLLLSIFIFYLKKYSCVGLCL